MKSSVDYIYDSLQGFARSENKDGISLQSGPDYTLASIFDGVSSDEHARLGVVTLTVYIQQNYARFYQPESNTYDLKSLMFSLHDQLTLLKENEVRTTCAVLFLPKKGHVQISHLGDSRIYGFDKQGEMKQYTKDHNIPEMPNILTRCLGMKSLDSKCVYQKEITNPYENWLLCTDGFYSLLERNKPQFLSALNKNSLQDARNALRDLLINANQDDATYLLLRNSIET